MSSPFERSFDALEAAQALELREMQEQDNWVRHLKQQRERVQHFTEQLAERDRVIRGLQDDLAQAPAAELLKLRAEYEKLEAKLQSQQLRAAGVEGEQAAKLAEYQSVIEQLRKALRQDKHLREQEVAQLQKQRETDAESQAQLRAEVQLLRATQLQSDELINRLRSEARERAEDQAVRLSHLEDSDRRWREQVNYLSFEKSHLEQKLKDLYLIAKEQEHFRADSAALSGQLQAAYQERDALKSRVSKLELELEAEKGYKMKVKERARQDFALLKEDLEAGAKIIQRQEGLIGGLRQELKEARQHIGVLQKALERSQQDQSKSHQEELLGLAKQRELEAQIELLRKEKKSLAERLEWYADREAEEKRQREEWARHKIHLLDQRQREVSALNEALQGLSS